MALQDRDIGLIHVDHVSGQQSVAEKPEFLEVADHRRPFRERADALADQALFMGELGHVKQNGHALTLRESLRLQEPFGRHGIRSVGRDRRRNQRVPLPLLDELLGVGQSTPGLGRVDHRESDDGLAQHSANSDLGHRAGDLVLVVVHVGDQGHSRQRHLDGPLARGHTNEIARQHFLLEREEKLEQAVLDSVLTEPSKRHHCDVVVQVDHSGHGDVAAGIDHDLGLVVTEQAGISNGNDGVATYRYDPGLIGGPRGVHSQDVGVLDDQVDALGRTQGTCRDGSDHAQRRQYSSRLA